MLISITQAARRYHASRRTLTRHIESGELTRHTHAQSGKALLETHELDNAFKRRVKRTLTDPQPGPQPAPQRAPADAQSAPRADSGMQVPHPDDLDAAYARMLSQRRSRLWPRLLAR